MALNPAVFGLARFGNSRFGYSPPALAALRRTRVSIMVAGVQSRARVRIDSLRIHDALNDEPNTASLTIDTPAPTSGEDVRITVNSDAPVLLFNGTLQTDDLSYEGLPSQLVYPVSAVDDLARLNHRRPFGTWVGVSVTTIAQDVIATFAPGFTSAYVEAGLPTTSIIFDGGESFASCLARLAKAIGGYFYVEDLDLHLFTVEATDAPDDLDSTPGRFLDDPPITVRRDESQVRTRVYGKGAGEQVLSDVAAGETSLPVVNAVMFPSTGGQAIAGTTADGAQSQIVTYTGTQLGGTGTVVGPGVTPSVGPTVGLNPGSGIESGVHVYAVTWVTASGETLPSPLASITLGSIGGAPTSIGTASNDTSGTGLTNGATYSYKFVFHPNTNPAIKTLPSPASNSFVSNGKQGRVLIAGSQTPPAGWDRIWYRTVANGSTYKLIGGGTEAGGYLIDSLPDGSLGADAPTTDTYNQSTIAGVALGPTGTTSRKVYRTVAGGAQLKLQQTIANNTDTAGVADATADASLGANVVTSDTSGLTVVAGQVNAGSTSLLTAGAGPFTSTGGWVLNGTQVIRYTGITGNTLTGIPAAGIGAIVNTILYGEHVDAAPALTGVTGLVLAMEKGSAVHIWVQRDDLVAQVARIALDAAQGRVSDGVIEHVISDGRRGEASLIALCDADLALFSTPIVTVTYATRDMKTKSGKQIVVNLASPPISETLTIQAVDIDQIDIAPGLAPRFTVTASNVRFSLDAMLRKMAAALEMS